MKKSKELAEALIEMLEENMKLLMRIDKAIEYLKAMQNSDLIFTAICEKELLEILGDKEIEEIPQFKGTLEELDNLTLGDKENE